MVINDQSTIVLPITLQTGNDITGIYFEVQYDSKILNPISIKINNNALPKNFYETLINMNEKGIIRTIVWAKNEPVFDYDILKSTVKKQLKGVNLKLNTKFDGSIENCCLDYL